MSKAGRRILDSVRETRAEIGGEAPVGYVVHVPETVDVGKIREQLKMTQKVFAASFGFAYDALRDWECGRRKPDRAARVLLKVIEKRPDAVREALAAVGDD